jgi:hypothetical protein
MRVSKKFVRLGTGTDEINARDLSANLTPTNYTPTEVASEGTDKISAHLNGIDAQLASGGDTTTGTAVLNDNQSAAANITGLDFSADTFRAVEIMLTVERGTNFEHKTLKLLQTSTDWLISEDSMGDNTGVTISITSAGVVQYTSTNTGNAPSVGFRYYGVDTI